jgi:hypothetical protein
MNKKLAGAIITVVVLAVIAVGYSMYQEDPVAKEGYGASVERTAAEQQRAYRATH